jgi:hypothetical protein
MLGLSFATYEYDADWKPASNGLPPMPEVAAFVKKIANERAADGWELVAFQVLVGGICFAFRRPVVGSPYR